MPVAAQLRFVDQHHTLDCCTGTTALPTDPVLAFLSADLCCAGHEQCHVPNIIWTAPHRPEMPRSLVGLLRRAGTAVRSTGRESEKVHQVTSYWFSGIALHCGAACQWLHLQERALYHCLC